MSRLGLILLSLFCVASLTAQNKSAQAALDKLLADPVMQSASMTLHAVDLKDGRTIVSHRSRAAHTPASIMKVVTSAAALNVLGADFRFETRLAYSGEISNGVLDGDLYIIGSGDPTWGSDELEGAKPFDAQIRELVAAIQQVGITEITGSIIGDGTAYESAVNAPTWQWNDLGNYYGAGVSGLNINENRYKLTFDRSTSPGVKTSIISLEPQLPYVRFQNEVTTGPQGSRDEAYIFGAPLNYERAIRGTIPPGSKPFTIKGSIPDPPFFVAYSLAQKLAQAKIKISNRVTTQRIRNLDNQPQAQVTTLATYNSPPLSAIADRCNKESINLYAESMLKALGKKAKNSASTEAGVEAVYDFYESRGVNMKAAFIEDGSGLSPRTAISARHITDILSVISRDQILATQVKPSLAVAGESGTLKYILKNSQAKGKIQGKSGSMTRVRAYAGYATAANGHEIAFCVIVNNFDCKSSVMRKKLEPLLEALTK